MQLKLGRSSVSMCQLKLKEEVVNQEEEQEVAAGVYRINLIDWKLLCNPDFIRYSYKVIEITTQPDPFQYRDNWEVRTDVVGYAYSTGVFRSTVRCQEMYYFGADGFGSIVCEKCVFGARFALFSLYMPAYVNKIHEHGLFAAKCLYCNRIIQSKPISKCLDYKKELAMFNITPLYRCLRVYEKLAIQDNGTLGMLQESDEVPSITDSV